VLTVAVANIYYYYWMADDSYISIRYALNYLKNAQLFYNQLVVLGSVAGDRGRRANYIYGATKAGLETFLEGLRQRLHKAGVRVVTVKPGPVLTPMTANLPTSPIFVSASRAAECLCRAIQGDKDVVYIPGFWRWIMTIIRWIPRPVFKRL